MRELTEKQKRFALEYAIKCNAAQAAIAAGYSVKSSRYIGYKLLKNQRIAAMVKEALVPPRHKRCATCRRLWSI